MEINKKKREDLKGYFKTNKIPTEENFGELIDAGLNQAEDGIAKVPGGPIALEAKGETREVLNLFSSFADASPRWAIDLNPLTIQGSSKPGLNFRDDTGASRLYISSSGGGVGIGTIEPSSLLTIQSEKDGSMLSVSRTAGGPMLFEVNQEEGSGALSVRGGDGTVVSRMSGSKDKPGFFLSKVGVGTAAPEAPLHIRGEGAALRIANTDGKHWDLAGQEGNGDGLEFMPGGNESQRLIMRRDGSLVAPGGVIINDGRVGIGTTSPAEKLHVNNGRIRIQGAANTYLSVQETGSKEESRFWTHTDGKLYMQNNKGIRFGSIGHKIDYMNILDNGNVGIGTTPDKRLHVNGDIRAEGGLTIGGYLKTTHAVAFSAYVATDDLSGAINPLPMTAVTTNTGNTYNPEKSTFTAPVNGVYLFTMTMYPVGSSNLFWYLRLNTNGYVNDTSQDPNHHSCLCRANGNQGDSRSRTIVTQLSSGDEISIEQKGSGKVVSYVSGLEGVLLYALED